MCGSLHYQLRCVSNAINSIPCSTRFGRRSPELYKALHTAADFPLPPASQASLREKAARDPKNADALGCLSTLGSSADGYVAKALLGVELGPYTSSAVVEAGEAVRKEVSGRESRRTSQ